MFWVASPFCSACMMFEYQAIWFHSLSSTINTFSILLKVTFVRRMNPFLSSLDLESLSRKTMDIFHDHLQSYSFITAPTPPRFVLAPPLHYLVIHFL